MENADHQIIRIALFSEREEPQDYEVYIFDTNSLFLKQEDTFGKAFKRYLKEYNIGQETFAGMTGIAQGSISRYVHDKRYISFNYLCAVCIALRLHPCRQRHLFNLAKCSMPGKQGYSDQAAYIIRNYLDGCAYNEKYTLSACNEQLMAIGAEQLTKLISERRNEQ